MKKSLLALALPALLASCLGGGPTALYVRGVKPLNENERRESTPVDIRIFQLRDDAKFNQATVDQVWTNAKEVLADDVIAMKQVTVFPGSAEDKETKFELGDLPETVRFIGVLALFPKEDDKGPRKVAIAKKDAGSVLRFTGYHISVEK